MDDAGLVRRIERVGGLVEPVERIGGRCRTAPVAIGEAAAGQVLHHDVGTAVPLADVEDRDDVRMTGKARRRQRFALEAAAHLGVAREALGENLDRHLATELAVVGEVDIAHPAAADSLAVLVARGKNGRFD